MGSDLARITFDSSRGYRSVVAQQGRVTLEADVNEEAVIASEALRKETIDVVGPCGTPDDGYRVSWNSTQGLVAGKGTMYVGGWRLTEDVAVPFNNQPEWLDQPAQTTLQGNAVAALLVTEQSISATEDQALLEVALGGPDTAARTRMMQHLVLLPTDASLCGAAEKTVVETLKQMGLQLNTTTLELLYAATLRVSFFPPKQSSDPCCPPAQGGYLGADNQLVRVAVSSFSGTSGTLLWGWNNASFLYRATVVSPQVLRLTQAPIDAAHAPQPGQVIEILRTTMVLGAAADKNYVAAQDGLLVTLGTGTVYDPSSQQLTLPPGTTLPSDTNTLFVRLWQGTVPFTSGTTVQLDAVSGLAVTVKIAALPTAPLASRPYWCFAVRPNTPQSVYPQRYLEGAQRPDGPRQWLCDLAIVEAPVATAAGGVWTIIADCRKHFKPLTELGVCTCCELTLSPDEDWVTELNTALASGPAAISICLQPGSYTAPGTIVFSGIGVKITGAGEGTVINGPSLEVVLEFDKCPDVVLTDFGVTAGTSGYSNNPATAGLQGAVTIRACPQVDIERVFLGCADNDLRASSCLAVYNPVPASTNATGTFGTNAAVNVVQRFNLRVLNSQFTVGHFQVGILVVNADRTQIEGNFVLTPQVQRPLTLKDLAGNVYLVSRLKKQLINEMSIVDTAPATTKKQLRQLRRKQSRAAAAGTSVPVNSAKVAPPSDKQATPPEAPAAEAAPAPAPAQKQTDAVTKSQAAAEVTGIGALPRINLGLLGRAHVTATYGTLRLQLISSDKLTNAWTDALAKSGLNQTSTAGQVHTAVHAIAERVFTNPDSVAPAFRNFVSGVLPALFSTSAQGIVIAGNVANDVRILNNTIDGTAQGIHVGLSDRKAVPVVTGLSANAVQICGNTINIRLTSEMTGDRHGIFVGCVQSAVINDNHLELFRGPNAGQSIYAIKVSGAFGPRVLIERNAMLRFTLGLVVQTNTRQTPAGDLWKAADNVSTSDNFTGSFRITDNIP